VLLELELEIGQLIELESPNGTSYRFLVLQQFNPTWGFMNGFLAVHFVV
jgi:hypothetical protein